MVGLGRRLMARLLGLPAPRCGVRVERDLPVEMPDGVHLLADHYAPRAPGEFPTILIRTPYGRGREVALGGGYALAELPAQRFAERGYHVVVQGARGCYDSDGTFSPHLNEAADGQATLSWLSRQSWFDGVLGTWGPSYLGYMQWALVDGAAPVEPAAMVIMVASAENHGVTYPDGAFGLETRLRWCQGLHVQRQMHGRPVWAHARQRLSGRDEARLQRAFDHLPLGEADVVAAGAPVPFYREMLAHDRPDDEYWSPRDHRDAAAGVTAPVHLVGGWYDYYLRGLLRDYHALVAAGRQPYLTIGPWYHGQPEGLLAGLRAGLTWFDAHLKAQRADLREEPVRVYVMGRETWHDLEAFPPPARPVRYCLQPASRLSTDSPPQDGAPACYRYDPADPTPAVGGALLALRGAGAQDNRTLEARSDVLCYTTEPLARDVEVAGPVRLLLFARSSLAHADFFGRLCDVAPDGRSSNVCDGLVRVEPGSDALQEDGSLRLEIELWATAYRFLEGHRLRVQISSGAHPRWSRNLGTGASPVSGVGMAVADQTIYHDAARPSAIVLPATHPQSEKA